MFLKELNIAIIAMDMQNIICVIETGFLSTDQS